MNKDLDKRAHFAHMHTAAKILKLLMRAGYTISELHEEFESVSKSSIYRIVNALYDEGFIYVEGLRRKTDRLGRISPAAYIYRACIDLQFKEDSF